MNNAHKLPNKINQCRSNVFFSVCTFAFICLINTELWFIISQHSFQLTVQDTSLAGEMLGLNGFNQNQGKLFWRKSCFGDWALLFLESLRQWRVTWTWPSIPWMSRSVCWTWRVVSWDVPLTLISIRIKMLSAQQPSHYISVFFSLQTVTPQRTLCITGQRVRDTSMVWTNWSSPSSPSQTTGLSLRWWTSNLVSILFFLSSAPAHHTLKTLTCFFNVLCIMY